MDDRTDRDDYYSRAGFGELFQEVLARRLSRRAALRSGAVASALLVGAPLAGHLGSVQAAPPGAPSGQVDGALRFTPIGLNTSDEISVARGYRADVLIRWGDPVLPNAPRFNPERQSPEAQAMQFGYNCDFVSFLPLPLGSKSAHHGLLWVNHEYTNPELMFAGFEKDNPTRQQMEIELAAHGASIVEIQRDANGSWSAGMGSNFNRRLTATSPMALSGPALGHEWLKTSADPSGGRVAGMLNNCGGGITPWGTVLTAEENFHQYFGNLSGLPDEDPRKAVHQRYRVGVPGDRIRLWERLEPRFDLAREPNEPFRFGWIVEVDPYDPNSTPRKRTALGRFLHEAATVVVTPSGRVAVYTGDDERFEYAYKFVSSGTYNPNDRQANMSLLDEGTLHVARLNDDGTGQWLPLVWGQGPLTPANGFASRADVLLKTRYASDLLGATRMDRPEDIETNPATGKVYLVMTNNNQRGAEGRAPTNAANPRADNRWGHILELTEAGNDHAATTFDWNVFMLCGEATDESTYFAGYPRGQITAIAAPDNIAFDNAGNLWIATDGQPNAIKFNDGIYAVPTSGPERGYVRQFLSGVKGCETASLAFNPDDTALFVSIQHPGEAPGAAPPMGEPGTVENPISVWPDGTNVPRPSVVVVWGLAGTRIGAA